MSTDQNDWRAMVVAVRDNDQEQIPPTVEEYLKRVRKDLEGANASGDQEEITFLTMLENDCVEFLKGATTREQFLIQMAGDMCAPDLEYHANPCVCGDIKPVPAIDKRTGKEYVQPDFGHGTACRCEGCIRKTVSDLVEAGVIEIAGMQGAEPVYKLPE